MNAWVLVKWLAILGIVAITLCCWGCAATLPLGSGSKHGAVRCAVDYIPPQWTFNPDLTPRTYDTVKRKPTALAVG
jgi:hypothetical protein